MTWSFGISANKQAFVNGWPIYVKPALSYPPKPPPPDYYWNPRSGTWNLYVPSQYEIQNKGWPTTDISGVLVNPSTTYDQITAQYGTIGSQDQPYACWDPRNGQWMSVSRGSGAGDKAAALQQLFREVSDFHQKGYLSAWATNEIQTIIQHEAP